MFERHFYELGVAHRRARRWDFRGQSDRREAWRFVLFATLILILAAYIDFLMPTPGPSGGPASQTVRPYFGLYAIIASILLFVPNLATVVRRLRDAGLSYELAVLPAFGTIALIALSSLDLFDAMYDPQALRLRPDGWQPSPLAVVAQHSMATLPTFLPWIFLARSLSRPSRPAHNVRREPTP